MFNFRLLRNDVLAVCALTLTSAVVSNVTGNNLENVHWTFDLEESKASVTEAKMFNNSSTRGVLLAPYSDRVPSIDGKIEEDEWKDAQVYEFDIGGRIATLFLKHVELQPINGTKECLLYPNNPDYRVPCGPYRRSLVLGLTGASFLPHLYFDEGDDGGRGSGRRDFVLTSNQEDKKDWPMYHRTDVITGESIPSCDHIFGRVTGCDMPDDTVGCSPWLPAELSCWTCDRSSRPMCRWSEDKSITATPTLLDIFLPGDSSFLGSGWIGNNLAYTAQYGDYSKDVEYIIPFYGDDLCERPNCSNVHFDLGDEIGFGMEGIYPPSVRPFNPHTWGGILILK